jgi:hypothetical protein
VIVDASAAAGAGLAFCSINKGTKVCRVPCQEVAPPSPRETTTTLKRRGGGGCCGNDLDMVSPMIHREEIVRNSRGRKVAEELGHVQC